MPIMIVIDGPPRAGRRTLGKRLALEYELAYLDEDSSPEYIRALASKEPGAVIIGSIAGYPQADAKFFVTASLLARAEREFADLSEQDPNLKLAEVRTIVLERDKNTKLLYPEGAILIDTTSKSPDDSFEHAMKAMAALGYQQVL